MNPMDLAALFDSTRRLYQLQGAGPLAELQVQAWSLREALSEPGELHISCLAQRADLDIQAMLGQRVDLRTTLADGSHHDRSGIVMAAQAQEGDGGFARYALEVQPWIGLLAQTRRSQVWQERSLVAIIDSVFADYAQHAAWQWAPDVDAHLANSAFSNAEGLRSYCVQYRETDLAFVQRLLAEEGLAWRVQPDAAAPLGHSLWIFADSAQAASCPEDSTSASAVGGAGIRFHRQAAVEEQDTVQVFGGQRTLLSTVASTVAWDYKTQRAVGASVPTAYAFGGSNAAELASLLESYQPAGAYAHADSAKAERAAVLLQQTLEARHKRWLGRSTVRSFSAGTSFALNASALDMLPALGATHSERDRQFLLTEVVHAGINNLPEQLSAQLLQQAPATSVLAPWVPEPVRAQAAASGYGNAFSALRATVPWRPWLWDDTGALLNPRPTAPGLQTATVVGPEGEATWPQEAHVDRLGRVRVRFPWQDGSHRAADTSRSSTWVRVVQRWAGAGHGVQFLPRVGQEVLVAFIEDDIDRPLVQGALYNGRGEAGVPATPGGLTGEPDRSPLAGSSDHAPGAQGNLAAGHSPAWHGAAPGDAAEGAQAQSNAAALSGFKTQEFAGSGYNQLVFDDTDSQLRVQLASTQHASQLHLGHLLHQADNHRGSLRGLGFELRTDAWGAVRGARGVLLSTYGQPEPTPAGDNAAGLALARQLATLTATLSGAAKTHQATQLASHIGSLQAAKAIISDKEAPTPALLTSLKGMVSNTGLDDAQGDAAAKNTATGDDKLPHSADALLALSARAGLGLVAGQDLQFASGETLSWAAGQHLEQASGGAVRIHTGQSIGVLAGAIEPGAQAAGKGLTLIAAQGDIQVQAQADTLRVAAQKDVSVQSQSAHIDWAAAKKIILATAGGAAIVIEGGNITVTAPGKIGVWAGKKSFGGGGSNSYPLPTLPQQVCLHCLLSAQASGAPFAIR